MDRDPGPGEPAEHRLTAAAGARTPDAPRRGGAATSPQERFTKAPDPVGLAVARVAQKAVEPNTVILFGSRARGDHRPDSDVDLLVICRTEHAMPTPRIKRAIKAYFAQNPPELGVDIIPMAREKFEYSRRAKNHVAGQALRDGIIMSDERLDHSNRYEDGYPDSWPDVKQRLRATHRHLRTFEREFSHPEGEQESYGFNAQQAVENAMKAWMSAADIDYQRIRDLQDTAERILNDPAESQTLAAEQLRLLMNYTTFEDPDHPAEYDNWLTKYAVTYRYEGTGFRMDDLEKNRFRQEIIAAALTFVNRAHELCGTDPSDLQ